MIKGNEIKEPGFFGKTLYIIDGNTIKTPGPFGGAFLGTVVAKTSQDGKTLKYNAEDKVFYIEKIAIYKKSVDDNGNIIAPDYENT